MSAFGALFGTVDAPVRLGHRWLRFFRVPQESWKKFVINGLAACGLHDLGKANNGFQNAVRRRGEQLIRHEHLSALLVNREEFDVWLKSNNLVDTDVVLAAVAGHHLKCSWRQGKGYPALAEPVPSTEEWFKCYFNHSGFFDALNRLANILDLPQPEFQLPILWALYAEERGESLDEARDRLTKRLHSLQDAIKSDSDRHRLMMAVKASVIIADSAGSGLVREGHSIIEWIQECFSSDPLTAKDIEEHVWQPRTAQISQATSEPFKETRFQAGAASMSARSLLLAPCGSGKTLAAWRWIQARLNERPARNVLFLYPTRGTATEGFRDYVSHAPEADATLLSGTSAFDLQGMFCNPDDARSERDYSTEDRLYAMGYWHKRVFAATVDQFLGFMQQIYRSVCLLPVLVDSVIVFDEVHSFDTALFDALRRFLAEFNVPALCMTASLPSGRRAALQALGLEVHPQYVTQFAELNDRAKLPRYKGKVLQNQDAAAGIAQRALERGARVLWVVNSVDRCQTLASKFNGLCYHSRFRLSDRKGRHEDIIAKFKGAVRQPVIAVTTQVCEMSLDLDADVLITEAAPISALIQRMGRCNRHAKELGSPLGEVFIYTPESRKPYDEEDLHRADEFLAAIDDSELSQLDLARLLEEFTADQANEALRIAAFVDDGPWSVGGREELREGNDFCVSAVLDADVEVVLAARRGGDPIDKWIVPVPRHLAQPDSRLGFFPQTAPATHYDTHTGFHKEALPEKVEPTCLII